MSKKKHELKKAERMAKKEKRAEGKRQEREDRGTFKEQLANLLFAYKFIYKANKKLFLFRIPLLVLQSAKSVVPIFFVREILNEITEGKSLEKVKTNHKSCNSGICSVYGKTRKKGFSK